jgi:hypothetical protein
MREGKYTLPDAIVLAALIALIGVLLLIYGGCPQ